MSTEILKCLDWSSVTPFWLCWLVDKESGIDLKRFPEKTVTLPSFKIFCWIYSSGIWFYELSDMWWIWYTEIFHFSNLAAIWACALWLKAMAKYLQVFFNWTEFIYNVFSISGYSDRYSCLGSLSAGQMVCINGGVSQFLLYVLFRCFIMLQLFNLCDIFL